MAKTPPKKKEVKKPAKKKPKENVEEKEGFRGIVRIAGKDITGHVPLKRALLRVKGIGQSLSIPVSNILTREMKLDPNTKVGELDDSQIEKIDSILFNLHKYGISPFMLNRNKERSSGENKHVIMNDLLFALREDIEYEKRAYSWRGYRHAYGQKVRGQNTRNTGRKGMAVGVLRKSVVAAQKGGAGKGDSKDKKK
jgi:small subunit ribosomal protein S13